MHERWLAGNDNRLGAARQHEDHGPAFAIDNGGEWIVEDFRGKSHVYRPKG
jgi:hypothetical protein